MLSIVPGSVDVDRVGYKSEGHDPVVVHRLDILCVETIVKWTSDTNEVVGYVWLESMVDTYPCE